MSAALDFRKCKRLLLSSLAVSCTACRGTRSVQTMRRIVTSPVANQDMKKRTEQFRFVLFLFGADNRTCSERSERNSGTGEFIRGSEAPAAQRAVANKRSAVCRQNVVLFQVRCRMKKDNPFGLSFFGADNRTCSERSERNSASKAILLPSGASAACRGTQSVQTMPCIVTSPVANQDMKKRTEQFRFVFVCFGADNRT